MDKKVSKSASKELKDIAETLPENINDIGIRNILIYLTTTRTTTNSTTTIT